MASNQKRENAEQSRIGFGLRLLATLIFLGVAAVLIVGGARLVMLSGSPYYLAAGLTMLSVGVLVWLRNRLAPWIYATFMLASIVWAVAEAGLDCWALLARLGMPLSMGLWFAIPFVGKDFVRGPKVLWDAGGRWSGLACLGVFVVGLGLVASAYPRYSPVQHKVETAVKGERSADQWPTFGGDAQGDHFSAADQVSPANVKNLKVAWTARTNGPFVEGPPLKIGDALYICSAVAVTSIDAETGREKWVYRPKPGPRDEGYAAHCRGVSYHRGGGSNSFCDQVLFWPTDDDRLHQIDLLTGRACPAFGGKGFLDLSQGIGKTRPGWHFTTSAPLVVGELVVVGSQVKDNAAVDMPSGVVRAFNVRTGSLVWAWDVQQPYAHPPLKPGEVYPRSSPNAWGTFNADPELGLIYIPTGNSSPDRWGGDKTPDQRRYDNSVVAVEAATGDVRWSFQTVHLDLWDLDVNAQPVLADLDRPGGRLKALIAPTKRGDIFVLDRATGKPISPVEERPAPKGNIPGEKYAPTQPYPVNFPTFMLTKIRETDMWGATLIDQMLCRIMYREARYEGPFTPRGVDRPVIASPYATGALNWGGVAIDPERQLMFVNSNSFPAYLPALTPAALDEMKMKVKGEPGRSLVNPNPVPAYGSFLSPLKFPCLRPPWGEVAAIDLRTDKLLWRRPFGTTEGVAPLGLALPTGIFNVGGAAVTRSGLAFVGAAMDGYLRAYDIQTGEELWRGKLPAGGQSNPITYVSEKTGKQYVVIAATGHTWLGAKRGESLVAYALP